MNYLEKVLTATEAEERWQLTAGTVRAACQRGIIKCRKSAGTWLTTIAEMERYYGGINQIEKKMYTVQDLQTELGTNGQVIRELVRNGILKAEKKRGRWLFTEQKYYEAIETLRELLSNNIEH